MNFKVGDKIAIYDLDRNLELARVTATITEILESGQIYTDHNTLTPFDASMVHPKQCRKLKIKISPETEVSYMVFYVESCEQKVKRCRTVEKAKAFVDKFLKNNINNTDDNWVDAIILGRIEVKYPNCFGMEE